MWVLETRPTPGPRARPPTMTGSLYRLTRSVAGTTRLCRCVLRHSRAASGCDCTRWVVELTECRAACPTTLCEYDQPPRLQRNSPMANRPMIIRSISVLSVAVWRKLVKTGEGWHFYLRQGERSEHWRRLRDWSFCLSRYVRACVCVHDDS